MNKSIKNDTDAYRESIIKQASETSITPKLAADWIENIRRKDKIEQVCDGVKDAANREDWLSPSQKQANLSPAEEAINLAKFYREAAADFVFKLRQNQELKEAVDMTDSSFLDNFEKNFIWGEVSLDEKNNIIDIQPADGQNNEDAIGICAVIPHPAKYIGDPDFVTIIQNDQLTEIYIYPYPVDKKWAAILLLQKLLRVHKKNSIGADDERSDALAYISAIMAIDRYIGYYNNNWNYGESLVSILLARKIMNMRRLAPLLKNNSLTKNEIRTLETAIGGKADPLTKKEQQAHLEFFNQSLMATYFMLELKKTERQTGSYGEGRIFDLFMQFKKEMGWNHNNYR